MSPEQDKHPNTKTDSQAPSQASPQEAKKSLNLDLKSLAPHFKKLAKKFSKHSSFAVIIAALLVYLFVVWQIRGLITAEPSIEAEEEALTSTKIPSIDQKAISQIESLERSNAKIRSLFDEARNNPFHE